MVVAAAKFPTSSGVPLPHFRTPVQAPSTRHSESTGTACPLPGVCPRHSPRGRAKEPDPRFLLGLCPRRSPNGTNKALSRVQVPAGSRGGVNKVA